MIVIEQVVSSTLVQEQGDCHKPIYFVNKVLQVVKFRYQKLKKSITTCGHISTTPPPLLLETLYRNPNRPPN